MICAACRYKTHHSLSSHGMVSPSPSPSHTYTHTGQPCRYTYVGEMAVNTDLPKFVGAVKMDLTTGEVAGRVTYGPQQYGGEAVFVPARDPSSEDDGYLITFVTDETDAKGMASSMVVYNSKTMDATPVAVVKLPHRVPYGFHGLHINEEQFQAQRAQ